MTKKIVSVVLAVLMLLTVIPFAVFADEDDVTAESRVARWNQDAELVIDKLLDNTNSTHWKYVAENDQYLSKTMLTYTIFSLYDDAWKNGFDNSVSVDRAEEILVSLIEKVDANVGESKVAEIRKVLEAAVDLNDLLQKVNGIIEFSDTLNSTSWNTAFQYIEWTIEAADLYEECRDRVIDAYVQILSVQAANDLYIEFLQYVADNCTYLNVITAANNLIESIEESVDSLIKKEVLNAAGFGASKLFDTAARIAMNTNSYTAVALKVYDTGTSVADTLWNTSDQYELMDELYTTFFVETCAASWAMEAKNSPNIEKYEFALLTLISLRKIGCDALYNLKVAQNGGIIGRIKDQINYNISFQNIAESAFLDLALEYLTNEDYAGNAVKKILTVSSNCFVNSNGALLTNANGIFSFNEGIYNVVSNAQTGQMVKVIFLTDDAKLELTSGSDCLVTLIEEEILYGKYVDYSFTDATVGHLTSIVYDTKCSKQYQLVEDEATTFIDLNDDFVNPKVNAVTAETVSAAVQSVVKEEATTAFMSIQEFFVMLGETIKNIWAKVVSFFTP